MTKTWSELLIARYSGKYLTISNCIGPAIDKGVPVALQDTPDVKPFLSWVGGGTGQTLRLLRKARLTSSTRRLMPNRRTPGDCLISPARAGRVDPQGLLTIRSSLFEERSHTFPAYGSEIRLTIGPALQPHLFNQNLTARTALEEMLRAARSEVRRVICRELRSLCRSAHLGGD